MKQLCCAVRIDSQNFLSLRSHIEFVHTMSTHETSLVQANTELPPVHVIWVYSSPGWSHNLIPTMTWLRGGRLRIDVPVRLPADSSMRERMGVCCLSGDAVNHAELLTRASTP